MNSRWNRSAAALLVALAVTPAAASASRMQCSPLAAESVASEVSGTGDGVSLPSTAGEVVVRFRDNVSGARREQWVDAFGCQVVRAYPRSGYLLVRVRDNYAADWLRLLASQPEVLHAEPCYELHSMAMPAAVVDPDLRFHIQDLTPSYYDPYEWYLFDRGTVSARALSNFGIQAASAWTHTRGAGVTVAVIDTGVAYEEYGPFHPAPALSQTRLAPGYNVLARTDHPDDDNGSGTHNAGVLASNRINGGGVVGVAPAVTVMPVKVMESDGSGRDADIAEGIRWAADHGASVIALSMGGPAAGKVLADAVNYAASKDCVLVAPAGNTNAAQVNYPAGYTDCIAVGATGFNGLRTPYSNRGRNLEVVAPGGNQNEDLNGDGQADMIVAQTFDPRQGYESFAYRFYWGTASAAALVAGEAALVRAVNPGWSALDVRLAIRSTALHLGAPGRNNDYGYGLVDAAAAVQSALAQNGSGG